MLQVIPITTINIQKVYGATNTIQHAKTTNNTISLRAATSAVIDKMLPRNLDDIGMIFLRSRSRRLVQSSVHHKYENIPVDPAPVLRALGVLTGTVEGMVAPLNCFYSARDTSVEHAANHERSIRNVGGLMPHVDMTEDDNDDEMGNTEQEIKRKIRLFFGGKRYCVKEPKIYNSRFNAHMYVEGHGAVHSITAACHWDFGGTNILHTCHHLMWSHVLIRSDPRLPL